MGSKNIIIFGESGCGKSSIVNMIAGRDTANVSSSPIGCTFKYERHEASIEDLHFNIYDTAGEYDHVHYWQAIDQLYKLIRTLDGVSLLIYCTRGHIKNNARVNWVLFREVLCAKKVPIIAVETGLENEDLEGRRTVIKRALKGYGIVPRDIACVVSVRGRRREYEDLYNWSQRQLRHLITHSCRGDQWSMTTYDWIGHIYRTTYNCLFSGSRVEFSREARSVVHRFIEMAGMEEEEMERLNSTLLIAENKLIRRFFFF